MTQAHDITADISSFAGAWVGENPERAATLFVSRRNEVLLERGFGAMHPLPDPSATIPVQANTIFLVASITKPLTAAALCLLVDRAQAGLDDPVSAHLPAFGDGERGRVTLRHLLTHTSGLPDMLPENVELRAAHAPLGDFVERTCSTPLLYAPGTDCRYQSMGILLAGAVVERITGIPLPQFLASEFFGPLEMDDTWLGLGHLEQGRMARVILPPEEERSSWAWNSLYWRRLGAPWGGLHTTSGDYARFLRLMLSPGEHHGRTLLSTAMTRAMLSNQLAGIPDLPAKVLAKHGWGLGWRLNRPASADNLPPSLPDAFGHSGATGTLAWADPASGITCVLLTNDPGAGAWRGRLSGVVAQLAGG